MRNYDDFLQERIQNLTTKLSQKQREGNLSEELALCTRLAQLHDQLGASKSSVQFWQSCMQIAADLGKKVEEWRAVTEIAKIYCKTDQIDAAEAFIDEFLKAPPQASLQFTMFRVEVLQTIAQHHGLKARKSTRSVTVFLAFERALCVLDEALEGTDSQDPWWIDAVILRADLLVKLGFFEESRYSEAIEVYKAIQSSSELDGLSSLRCKASLASVYFELKEHRTALSSAISVIDEYKSNLNVNSNYRPRRRIYCEMLHLTGRVLAIQRDFNFALQNLLLAKEEAQALAVEREFFDSIEGTIKETLLAQEAANEVQLLQRRGQLTRPKDLEDLAGKYEVVGDYERACEMLEQCRAIAINSSTQRRLDEKLLFLSFDRLDNWQHSLTLISRLEGSKTIDNTALLLMKSRALERLGRIEEAERCLLNFGAEIEKKKDDLRIQAALYFHYRQRGRVIHAERYRDEALSLETVAYIREIASNASNIRFDPSFSYFVTRKPSNSLMKMVGSGMVMRTKTRKTKGLELKRQRRRGAGSSLNRSSSRRITVEDDSEEDKENMSNFIVSSDSEDHDKVVSQSIINNVASKRVKPACVVIDSSSESSEDSSHKVQKHSTPKNNRTRPTFSMDSPLFVNTERIVDPLELSFDEESLKQSYNPSSRPRSAVSKVIVRIRKGADILIPLEGDVTVGKLMEAAQSRYEKLFVNEFRSFGRICGLSLDSARLFEADKVNSVISADSQVLQAHFSSENSHNHSHELTTNANESSTALDQEFHRKFQVLNLKKADEDEVLFLKAIQERFNANANDDLLDLSGLSLQTEALSEYCGLLNKFMRLSSRPPSYFSLNDNFLVDEDLRLLGNNFHPCRRVNLSKNFFKRPNWKSSFTNCVSLDLSYNPIDLKWLGSQLIANKFTLSKINLIGCLELSDGEVVDYAELGCQMRHLKSIKVSHLPDDEFLKALCKEEGLQCIEELTLFAVEAVNLGPLSYLDNLSLLDLTGCSFRNDLESLDSLCKVLKRSSTLKRLVLCESDLSDENFRYITVNGIELNYSLKQVER